MMQYLDTIIAFVVIMLGVSLLITIITQMVSALFGLRGTNLLWGLKTLLGTVEPQLRDKADALADRILQTPLLSDSVFSKFRDVPVIGKLTRRWRLASEITTEELVIGLKYLAENLQATDKPTAALIETALTKADPEMSRKVQMIQAALGGFSSNYQVQLDKTLQQLGANVQTSLGEIETAFDSLMKRVSQRFALQMRIWTIILALLIAFGLQLDSFGLIRQLWINPVLRDNLVDHSEMMQSEASVILAGDMDSARSGASGMDYPVLVDAIRRLKETEIKATAHLPKTPDSFESMDEAVQWLQANLKTDQKTRENLTIKYKALVVDILKTHADTIRKSLSESGIPLKIISLDDVKNNFSWLKLLGILISVGLLSLGPTFLFNTLKLLCNLRPLTAKTNTTSPTT